MKIKPNILPEGALERLTMPAFKEPEVRALLTSFGLTDNWMLRVPPFDVSNLATTHLITMPG